MPVGTKNYFFGFQWVPFIIVIMDILPDPKGRKTLGVKCVER
jgi:hypothetical protein